MMVGYLVLWVAWLGAVGAFAFIMHLRRSEAFLKGYEERMALKGEPLEVDISEEITVPVQRLPEERFSLGRKCCDDETER